MSGAAQRRRAHHVCVGVLQHEPRAPLLGALARLIQCSAGRSAGGSVDRGVGGGVVVRVRGRVGGGEGDSPALTVGGAGCGARGKRRNQPDDKKRVPSYYYFYSYLHSYNSYYYYSTRLLRTRTDDAERVCLSSRGGSGLSLRRFTTLHYHYHYHFH